MLLFSDKYRTSTIRLFELSNAYVRYEFLYNIDWCEFVNVNFFNGKLRFLINKAVNADILLSFRSTGFVVFAFSRLLNSNCTNLANMKNGRNANIICVPRFLRQGPSNAF